MRQYRFSFQWFTPDKTPTVCVEFSVFAYNYSNAIDRALQKITDAGINVEQDLKNKSCVVSIIGVNTKAGV